MGDYRDNAKDYVSFVMLQRNRASYSFTDYLDAETGEVQMISQHIDPRTGIAVPRRFKWTSNQPVFKVPIKNTKVIEHIRNSPGCYGSKNARNPNAPKSQYMIAEINDAEDAKIANDANRMQIKAQALAYGLEEYPEKLARIARILGEDSLIPDIQLFACTNYVKNNAAKFIELVEGEESEAKDLVERALKQGLIKKQGFMYRLGEIHVGSHNENDVISKVSGDPDLLKSLKLRLGGAIEATGEDLPVEFAETFEDEQERDSGVKSTS